MDAAFHFEELRGAKVNSTNDFLNIPGADANGLTEVKRRVHAIVVRIDPRTTNGDSLLHMACMRKNKLRDQQLFEESTVNFFPSPSVVRLLVECGAKVNSTNALANTPLHTASVACNFNQDVSYSHRGIFFQ